MTKLIDENMRPLQDRLKVKEEPKTEEPKKDEEKKGSGMFLKR
jgi:hypothetical protein